MAQSNKTCGYCDLKGHSKSYCPTRPRTAIKRNSVRNPEYAEALANKILRDNKSLPKFKVKKPKTKQQSKTVLKKKLEKLVKDYVKRRDDYTCQYCGKYVTGTDCHASHVIPVSRSGYLQFEPKNMKVLCHFHHLHWWHKHPVEAGKWFTDTFPERWEYLQDLHIQRLKPLTEAQLLEKIEYYKQKVFTN